MFPLCSDSEVSIIGQIRQGQQLRAVAKTVDAPAASLSAASWIRTLSLTYSVNCPVDRAGSAHQAARVSGSAGRGDASQGKLIIELHIEARTPNSQLSCRWGKGTSSISLVIVSKKHFADKRLQVRTEGRNKNDLPACQPLFYARPVDFISILFMI